MEKSCAFRNFSRKKFASFPRKNWKKFGNFSIKKSNEKRVKMQITINMSRQKQSMLNTHTYKQIEFIQLVGTNVNVNYDCGRFGIYYNETIRYWFESDIFAYFSSLLELCSNWAHRAKGILSGEMIFASHQNSLVNRHWIIYFQPITGNLYINYTDRSIFYATPILPIAR